MAFFEGWPNRQQRPSSSAAVQKPAKDRIKERLDSTFYTAITRNYMVWPWVQMANFSVVPLEHRVLVVNIVALGWNCYLSYINSRGQSENGKDD